LSRSLGHFLFNLLGMSEVVDRFLISEFE